MYPDVRPLDKQEVNITIGSFRDHLSEGICINNRLLLDGMGSRSVRGFWEPPRTLAHINVLELGAVYLSLRIFLPLLQNKHVLIKTDNMSAVYHINPPGWNHISIMSPGDKQTTFLIISETIVSQSSVHTESSKQSSRPAVSNWSFRESGISIPKWQDLYEDRLVWQRSICKQRQRQHIAIYAIP